MSMPPEINALLARFHKELERIEQEAIKGLKLTRTISEYLSDRVLSETFAFFNDTLFFVNTQKIRIQIIIDKINFLEETIDEKIQVLGKELDDGIDRVLEVKKIIVNIIHNLKKLK
ncbi:MAG: hypothetical protein HC820_03555 [Hydrococcus sp. RM1_1_31]|nr:hypothetical protein [Hydrococcus sp. RM1_1_31]